MKTLFYGQWQIDNNIDVEFAEKELLRYIACVRNRQIKKQMRAKFIVQQVTDFGYGSKEVKMNAVYSATRGTEDNQFSSATPSGELRMMISAKGAQDFLKPGVKYILTFEEAEFQE